MKRRQILILTGLAAAGPGITAPLVIGYPVKPITVVVPFPPGGPTDASARVFARSLSAQLGQPVVIENRAGAGGTVGTASVARALPDGYTLLWAGTSGMVVAPALYANLGKSLRYDPLRSFEPIALAVRSPMLLAGNNALKANHLSELIDASRTRVMSVATAGSGSVGHLSLEYLREMVKLNTLHVPYRGGAPALTDLLGGQVDLFFDSAQFLYPQLKDNKIKAYAVTGKTRYPPLPDVLTVAELVGQPFEAYSWFGLAAPAETPRSILHTLNAAMSRASQDTNVQKFITGLGLEPVRGTEEQFAKTISEDFRKWSGVAARANVRPEE